MWSASPGRQTGVTLLELILVIVIVAVALPALLGLMATGLRGIGVESESVRAAHVAQQRLEVLYRAKRATPKDDDDFFDNDAAFRAFCDDVLADFDGSLEDAGMTIPEYRHDCAIITDQRHGRFTIIVGSGDDARGFNGETWNLP